MPRGVGVFLEVFEEILWRCLEAGFGGRHIRVSVLAQKKVQAYNQRRRRFWDMKNPQVATMVFSNLHATEHRETTVFACIVASLILALPILASAPPSAQESGGVQKKPKTRSIRWDPPNVDAPVKLLSAASPCVLVDVLQHAGARAQQMKDNLPNFTADERIEYQSISQSDDLQEYGNGTFEYLVELTPTAWGVSAHETRAPIHGTHLFPAGTRDRGLPEMALIFLPGIQSDYDMQCNGETKWEGQPAWVIHFQQRAGVVGHTYSYEDGSGGVYVAKLKGRAWISADSGDVLHLETALVDSIPELNVRKSWFSIDYGPVQFHSQNLRFWLPQTVEAYKQFTENRTITYHTFSNFMLFSVQAKQEIEKPKSQ